MEQQQQCCQKYARHSNNCQPNDKQCHLQNKKINNRNKTHKPPSSLQLYLVVSYLSLPKRILPNTMADVRLGFRRIDRDIERHID